MTYLKKPIRREVPMAGKPYIIQLEPPVRDEPCVVRIKTKGKRTWYETTVDAIFWMAIRKTADRLREEKRLAKLAKKARQ